MKTRQIPKGLYVISIIIVCFSCKAIKPNTYIVGEAYKVAKVSINYLIETKLEYLKRQDKDTIILYQKVDTFEIKDFKKHIDNFQIQKEANLNIPECADSIYKNFDFANTQKEIKGILEWDISKLETKKVIKKETSEIKRLDHRLKLSVPVFNKKIDKALVLLNHINTGQIIYYLEKRPYGWEVKCEVYIAFH
ncbi:MAG: hypothetical protein H2058_08945 [Muricauda sp.]|nr:hypothetical protein [Allomuricauda sp.]MBA4745373.1 hypothetical protein [Allomuricauda sp.]